MLKKKRFLFGGIIVIIAIGFLSYTGFQSSATYYFTVSELIEQGSSIHGEQVRVNGQIVPGSVEQEPGELTLMFTITEGRESLPVVYQGVVPDSFQVGGDIVVEGSIDSGGIFQATTLMPKCPSKYVPAK